MVHTLDHLVVDTICWREDTLDILCLDRVVKLLLSRLDVGCHHALYLQWYVDLLRFLIRSLIKSLIRYQVRVKLLHFLIDLLSLTERCRFLTGFHLGRLGAVSTECL